MDVVLMNSSTKWIFLGLLFVLVAFSRFYQLAADPPYWVSIADIKDSCWWASGARAYCMFGDYLLGDYGMPYLILPAYTWLIKWVYLIAGVGLEQTRALAAIGDVLSITVLSYCSYKLVGWKGSLFAIVILGISPFYWGYGRVAIPESLQLLCISLTFLTWFFIQRNQWIAFVSGFFLGLSIAIKPTAVTMGVFPFFAAVVIDFGLNFYRERSFQWKRYGFEFVVFLFGMTLSSFLFFYHVFSHWELFWVLLDTEASLEKGMFNRLIAHGEAFVSKHVTGSSMVFTSWKLATMSIVLVGSAWLYFVDFCLGSYRSIWSSVLSLRSSELAVIIWLLCVGLMIFTSPNQVDYRQVSLIPPLAILASVFLSKLFTSGIDEIQTTGSKINRFLVWFVMLFPLVVIVKPFLIEFLLNMQEQAIGSKTLGATAIGVGINGIWFGVAVAFAFLLDSVKMARSLFNTHILRVLIGIGLLAEASILCNYLIYAESKLIDIQKVLANELKPGTIATGRSASAIFHSVPVKIVRRTAPTESVEILNLKALETKLNPTYLVLSTRYNFESNTRIPPLTDEVKRFGYTESKRFEFGSKRNSIYQYEYVLYVKPNP